MSVTVKIENTYEDGHETELIIEVQDPPAGSDEENLELWWEEEVWPHTGDGYGEKHPKLGCWYEATITGADENWLVGLSMEWG